MRREDPNLHAWLSPHGNSIAGKILVARRGHFVGRRQIDPELEAVNRDAFGGDFIMDQSAAGGHPLHVAWQDRAFMTLTIVVIDAALYDIGHGLDPSVRVLAENTAREPILHQRQERVRGCEISPHRRRHQWPDAMLRRHSLLNLRSVDPEDRSFDSSHGHSLLRPRAHHRRSEVVAVDSDPKAKSRPGSMSGLWRPGSDSALVVIYTTSAFLHRGRPDSTMVWITTVRASTDWGSTTKSSVCSGASSRREQSPLPTLAGFEFIAEDIASHDGSLSTWR